MTILLNICITLVKNWKKNPTEPIFMPPEWNSGHLVFFLSVTLSMTLSVSLWQKKTLTLVITFEP